MQTEGFVLTLQKEGKKVSREAREANIKEIKIKGTRQEE
jgi:hypothetical protein